MIVAATGHRLHLYPGYRGDGSSSRLREALLVIAMDALEEWSPDLTISGMATGWDMAVAAAAMLTGRPYHAYIPFVGQDRNWGKADKQMYLTLLESADKVVTVCPAETRDAYRLRDEAMVDKADRMLAMWLGASAGGTYNTLEYADNWLVPWTNYRDAFEQKMARNR
jgi:uncharacterized phage-like protein YoqJ